MTQPNDGPAGRLAMTPETEREIRQKARRLLKEHGTNGASRATGLTRQMLASLAAGVAVRHGSLVAAAMALGVPLSAPLPVALASSISYT
jgi:hypothetical protein